MTWLNNKTETQLKGQFSIEITNAKCKNIAIGLATRSDFPFKISNQSTFPWNDTSYTISYQIPLTRSKGGSPDYFYAWIIESYIGLFIRRQPAKYPHFIIKCMKIPWKAKAIDYQIINPSERTVVVSDARMKMYGMKNEVNLECVERIGKQYIVTAAISQDMVSIDMIFHVKRAVYY